MTTRQYHLLASLAMLMSLMGAEAQEPTDVPRLVVNVVVDQLRTDYLEAFMPLYGDRGFRRLMADGRVYQQAEYPFDDPDRASAVACLMTGATPYENGIVGERWLNRATLHPIYCVEDRQQTGYFTTEQVSPSSLGVSTITDELKISTEGQALVYSVAPNCEAALFAAGRKWHGNRRILPPVPEKRERKLEGRLGYSGRERRRSGGSGRGKAVQLFCGRAYLAGSPDFLCGG